MNTMLVRILTGAAFGIILLGAILYGHTSFAALFTLVSMLAVNEMSNLIHEYKKTTFSTLIAVIGDLAASAVKRDTGIKDYGKLIPGHGGVLDRFDSILFTAPIVYYLSVYLGAIH